MGINLLVGSGTLVLCLVIQCFGVVYLLRFLHKLELNGRVGSGIIQGSFLLVTVMLILLIGHLVQIAVWAKLFVFRGEFDDFTTAFYHSTVNFTSLGYGDIVMSEKARLLGALEAASGVMMFGLTTGVLFWVIQRMVRRFAENFVSGDHGTHALSKRDD